MLLKDGNGPASFDHIDFYQCDHLGTPLDLTDEAGNVTWEANIKAWGQASSTYSSPQSISTRFRFQGQYFDIETGLHYNRHRYYDPGIGRYVQFDPIRLLGGINDCAYANLNPLRYIDPNGLVACPGGIWDQDAGDLGVSVAAGGMIGIQNLNYVCRLKPNIKASGTQVCIGGGVMAGVGVSWSVVGTAYGAADSSNLGGWAPNQGFSNFNLGPIGVSAQAPVNGNAGGSVSAGGGLGFGLGYGSCYVKIKKTTCN